VEVGVPVTTRTTPPPKLNENEQAAFIEKVKAITPKYRTELLRNAEGRSVLRSRGTDKRAGRRLLLDCRQLFGNRVGEGFGGGVLLGAE